MFRPGLDALLVASASLCLSCDAKVDDAQLGLAVHALDAPGLPADVAELRVTYRVGDEAPEVVETQLADLEKFEGRRRLSLPALPPNSQLSVRIEGLRNDGELGYVGSVGPLELRLGEQLKVRVSLSPASMSQDVAGVAPPARFLHAASPLDDGRVLVTGGFSAPIASDCPSDAPDQARCFFVRALRDAWVFDPTTHTFHELESGMLEPRAGHTATVLGDGRVLLAGGARTALMWIAAKGEHVMPQFVARDEEGTTTLSASFELFEPAFTHADATHVDATREPRRGRFMGSAASGDQPGALLVPRFLHAAAENPEVPGQVLLAGGLGAARSRGSYEIFEAQRPGGYGIAMRSTGMLQSERVQAAALGLVREDAGEIWLLGGVPPRSNEDLAERWTRRPGRPHGQIASAAETAFPQPAQAQDGDLPQPDYAYPQVLTARFTGLQKALVVAALPPACDEHETPAFFASSVLDPAKLCRAVAPLSAGFVIDARDGTAERVMLESAHLLGAASELHGSFVVLSGGLTDLSGHANQALDRLELQGEPSSLVALPVVPMRAARSLHTTTRLPEGGALSMGGIDFVEGQPRLANAAEFVRW